MKKLLLLFILATAILTTACSNSGKKENPKSNTSGSVYDDKTEQKVYEEVTESFDAIKKYDVAVIKKKFGEGFLDNFIGDPESLKLLTSKMGYKVNSIELNDAKDKAFVEMSVTGVDTAKIVYEMLMFNYSFPGMLSSNKKIEKAMDDLTANVVNRNINNTRENTINITVDKEGLSWKIVKDVIIRDSILGSSIPYKDINAKVSDNIINERKAIAEIYDIEKPDISLEEYTNNKLTEFCENYLSEHINDYPFSEAFAGQK
jgi:major membrane immunogen (membrane-anchored lipoprotein)